MNGFLVGAKWGEDLDLWGRIALKYPIGFSTSRCSLIHIVTEGFEKTRSRVTITKENPFIMSASAAIDGDYSSFIDRDSLMLYLDMIIIDSARYNIVLGQTTESKDILKKCRTKAFLFTKAFLSIWNAVPEWVMRKNHKAGNNCLKLISSGLRYLELRALIFVIERRKNSRIEL